ncbi:hypothetical protein A3709_19040 [Halioglobus sp. HI00S01]|uniref:ATP-binding protein n=1 Tax=Halioglobus sp. HI00S01 TaxID=1822214 RepID=UPI0007C1FEBD|nr:ATP-binding protein [Halioglobus sp. HI00S01]KZX57721.1 hypothetical protein A3709_19040 [Halioglobus sp. HI00S01]
MSETLDIRVDQTAAIRQLIFNQSGSLSRACSELVSNSIDAGATDVHVKLGMDAANACTSIVVDDNGSGFTSKQEINDCFATLCFDHETEAEAAKGRRWGRFGLGRAQMWAHARVCYRTNKFTMNVDLRGVTKDFTLDLEEHDVCVHRGCHVDAVLYEPAQRWQIEQLRRELRDMVKYVPQDVYLDGELISEYNATDWTYEDENFVFLHRPSSNRGVDVYNLGMYVKTVAQSNCKGVSGVLVSKAAFELNTARNDIMRATDTLFPKAEAIFALYQQRNNNSMSASDREALLQDQLTGTRMSRDQLRKARIFLDARGRSASINMILKYAEGNVAFTPDSGSRQVAESVHSSGAAFVFCRRMVSWLNAGSAEEAFAVFADLCASCAGYSSKPPQLVDYHALASSFEGRSSIIDTDKLTRTERAQVQALSPVLNEILGAMRNLEGLDPQSRSVVVGESRSAEAWTDGRRYVAIERRLLRRSFYDPCALGRLIHVLIHECAHDCDSRDEHTHGVEFYERFEAFCTTSACRVWDWTVAILNNYEFERKKAKLSTAAIKTEMAQVDAALRAEIDLAELAFVASEDTTAPPDGGSMTTDSDQSPISSAKRESRAARNHEAVTISQTAMNF